jgi:hypothetical protein
MSSKKHEIESIIEEIIESIILDTFESNFNSLSELEYALTYLKLRIQDLEIEDLEYLLDQ